MTKSILDGKDLTWTLSPNCSSGLAVTKHQNGGPGAGMRTFAWHR